MSRQTPIKADIDPDAVPPRAPKNRDELVVENRARGPAGRADPAMPAPPAGAGSGKTTAGKDGTKDGTVPLIPTPRTSAVTTHAVNEDQSDPADVRAGPGDAGGQKSPRIVPGAPDEPHASGRAFPIFLGLIVGALLILALVAWL